MVPSLLGKFLNYQRDLGILNLFKVSGNSSDPERPRNNGMGVVKDKQGILEGALCQTNKCSKHSVVRNHSRRAYESWSTLSKQNTIALACRTTLNP